MNKPALPGYQDAHLHIEAAAELEISTGIKRVFLNSTGKSDIPAVQNAAVDSRVYPYFGIHPWNSADATVANEFLYSSLLATPEAGVGECGLDYSQDYGDTRELQLKTFETQLQAAVEYRRPLSIHCVRAWGGIIGLLRRYSPLPAPFILHSFYGSAESADIIIKLGGYISLSELSLRNPEKSGPVIRRIRFDRLLIESDLLAGSPGFSAETHLHKLENIYNTVSDIKAAPLSDTISRIWDNGTVFTN